MIEYTIEVYMEIILKDGKPPIRVGHKKEIDVREFLFTNEEVSEDWSNYQRIIDLKKVLRPTTIFASRTERNAGLDDAEDYKDENQSPGA